MNPSPPFFLKKNKSANEHQIFFILLLSLFCFGEKRIKNYTMPERKKKPARFTVWLCCLNLLLGMRSFVATGVLCVFQHSPTGLANLN